MALPPPSPSSTALVTGASAGIGADIARELAKRGQGVTLAARREDRLRELADELTSEHGVKVEVIAADLSEPAGRERLVKEIQEADLTVEVLINNAGFGSAGLFHGLDQDAERRMVRTNIDALHDLTSEYIPAMVGRGRGAVLNVASVAGFQPLPRQATYGATKAFVLSFSQALHDDLRDTGVTVTVLCPGATKTEFMAVADFEEEADKAPGFLWMSSADTAKAGVEGLEKGKREVIPGPVNQFGAFTGRMTPRSLILPIMRRSPLGK